MSAVNRQKTFKGDAKDASAPAAAASAPFDPNEWFDRMDVLAEKDTKTLRDVIKTYQIGQVLKNANEKTAGRINFPSQIRIVLAGFVSSGKSALVNTIKTALDARPDIDVKDVAETHNDGSEAAQEPLTAVKVQYAVTDNVTLIDTKGFSAASAADEFAEILNIVHGRVPKEAPIASPGQHVAQRKPVEDFEPTPCHLVALVLPANHTKEELEAIKRLEKLLQQDNIPSLFVVTKLDVDDPENKQGGSYQTQQDRFKGIEDRARVAVVQNYSSKNRKVDERINQFALYTLLKIVRRAELFGLTFVPKQTSEIVAEHAMSVPKAALAIARQRRGATLAILVALFALLFAYYLSRPAPEVAYEFKD